ncbi:MAG: NAD(P)H:quinone oxidoreductase [Desulforhabdus sp.]|nr:NAD(P)H:quinone oxidoreductase [Desulforhabdus sp.]
MKVIIVYHSLYGHILRMARAVEEGAGSVQGVEALLRRVEEFEDTRKMLEQDEFGRQVWETQKDIPVCTLNDLKESAGLLIGSPTRYGNMTAQMKKLIDSTARLWQDGAMEGKPVGFFTSTATTHGGQETTLITMMIPFLHLGMIVTGVPYSAQGMLHTDARGGTPYGATTIAGQRNELQPTAEDLDIAMALGRRVAETAKKLSA